MLAGGYSWRLFFYVVIAFAGALFIAAFFLVEETNYHRPESKTSPPPTIAAEKLQQPVHSENIPPAVVRTRKSFISTLKPWSSIDREAQFFTTMFRSFTYFFVPAVFWVITSFGTANHDEGSMTWLIMLIMRSRYLHRSRSFLLQLRVPAQNHRAAVQVE
jgi:hypothetical protein